MGRGGGGEPWGWGVRLGGRGCAGVVVVVVVVVVDGRVFDDGRVG